MPEREKPVTDILLNEYEETAEKLSRGEAVSPEAILRYQGVTGKLLVSATRGMWTERDLDEHIDTRLEKRCSTCERNTSDPWRGVLIAHAGKLIICGTIIITIIVSLAIIFNRIDSVRGLAADVIPKVSQLAP